MSMRVFNNHGTTFESIKCIYSMEFRYLIMFEVRFLVVTLLTQLDVLFYDCNPMVQKKIPFIFANPGSEGRVKGLHTKPIHGFYTRLFNLRINITVIEKKHMFSFLNSTLFSS